MPAPTLLTVKETLSRSTAWLSEKGVESPRLDAEVLLGHVLKLERLQLYLSWDRPLDEKEKADYRALLRRRASHEPVAYITGRKEFFGLPMRVTRDVLIPRPETELLVERALELLRADGEARERQLADVGTGSGAIAIALAHELPDAHVIATDLSPAALEVARGNAETHGVADRIDFRNVSLLEGVEGPLDLIASNPPYVAESDRALLASDVIDFEPAQALFAGPDGLDTIRQLVPQASERLQPGGYLVMEIGIHQSEKVTQILADDGRFEPAEIRKDYQGIDRIVTARRV